MNNHRRERGQVLVLIILAIVGIMGLLALAVDGGRIYAERRRAQAAADSAAYAAAFSASIGENWATKATDQLEQNGYSDISIIDNGKEIDVMIYNPPLDAPNVALYGDNPDEYFQVIIRTKVDPIFSQFVFGGPISMTVEAIARASKFSSSMSNKALVSTGPNNCDAIKYHGNNLFKLYGGSVYAHSKGKDGACDAMRWDGTIDIEVVGGGIYSVGSIRKDGASNGSVATTDGAPVAGVDQVSIPILDTPSCTGLPTNPPVTTVVENEQEINVYKPGIYTNGIKVTGARTQVRLQDGMYCLNDSLSMNGGVITGENVIIVMNSGSINIGGNTNVHLSAPANLEVNKKQWGGMLFFMPKNNTGTISISGNSNSEYTGTIYAPGPANPETKTKCSITGTSGNLAVNSAIICYSIDLGGTADVIIYYREKQNYRLPPTLQLTK